MPTVEAPFIIAVIREKEKSLLSDNELTRIMHATNQNDAREVLMSTPYAQYLVHGVPISDAVAQALSAELSWVCELLDNKKVIAFLNARSEGLQAALGILQTHKGQEPDQAFHDLEEDAYWGNVIARQKENLTKDTWSTEALYEDMQYALEQRLDELAVTPFMKFIVEHEHVRHEKDILMRANTELTSAVQYEYDIDAELIEKARTYRHEPTGYDPIIAYWITKEMEGKNIRMIFATLAGGFDKETIKTLIRPLAHV